MIVQLCKVLGVLFLHIELILEYLRPWEPTVVYTRHFHSTVVRFFFFLLFNPLLLHALNSLQVVS